MMPFTSNSVLIIDRSSYDLFADNTYADACLDRMVHKAFRLELNGKNMRNPV